MIEIIEQKSYSVMTSRGEPLNIRIDNTARADRPNGHHLEKSGGKTLYQGPLENLPARTPMTTAEAVERMYTDGYVLFPAVLNPEEVASLRALMDEKGGQDDEKWVVKNWCYNRHQADGFLAGPAPADLYRPTWNH